jgi:hypothetical protein
MKVLAGRLVAALLVAIALASPPLAMGAEGDLAAVLEGNQWSFDKKQERTLAQDANKTARDVAKTNQSTAVYVACIISAGVVVSTLIVRFGRRQ